MSEKKAVLCRNVKIGGGAPVSIQSMTNTPTADVKATMGQIRRLEEAGCQIVGLEAAVFIGVFAGLANVIPYFGPVLGMIPAFLMGLCTGGFWHGVLAVVILLAVQQIDSNFIYPKVVGSSTGLKPLVVLLAVSVFGYFGGIVGMLLAVPLAGIIQIFVLKWVRRREAKLIQKRRSGKGKIPPIMD